MLTSTLGTICSVSLTQRLYESTMRNYCNHRRNILATKRPRGVVLAGIHFYSPYCACPALQGLQASAAVTLYRISRIKRRWHLRAVSCRSLVLTSATSGMWSVSAVNDPEPTWYRSNFSQTQTMAKHSFSVCAYPFSAGVRVREQYATCLSRPS